MKPLAGIRIADFTVHAAGPFCTHMLSQLGAECIKIETALRPDIFRKSHAVYGRKGPATFDQVASNKLSIRLNLKNPDGVALAKRLVAISDVAAESFRAGVMNRLGLSYADLCEVKNDIVMVSVSSSGQTGPHSHFAGYAPLFGAWGGLGYLSGHADGPPVEMRHVMDHSVGLNAALATVAALHQRRRSGKGAHVDIAAREVASSFVGDALTAASTGVEMKRMGNDDYQLAPHGLYPTENPDRWLSIAVGTNAEWQALAEIVGGAKLCNDARFSTQQKRHDGRRYIDEIISAWSKNVNGEVAVELLQSNGVASHLSWSATDIVNDPHLRERGSIVDIAETDGKIRAAVGCPGRFTKNDSPSICRGTPGLGEHEEYVFGDLLRLSTDEITSLRNDKAIY